MPQPHLITLQINEHPLTVEAGTTVAAAIARAGVTTFRHSTRRQPRAPLCGMGTCFECRVTINQQPHVRSCLTLCTEGMQVSTGAPEPSHFTSL